MARDCAEVDSEFPITGDWLESSDFANEGLGYSRLLETSTERAAIIEVLLTPPTEPGGDWGVSLLQDGGPTDDPTGKDDQVTITSREFRTRGDFRQFMRGMGVDLWDAAGDRKSTGKVAKKEA